MFARLIVLTLLGATSPASAWAAGKFDGVWKVEGTTDVGECKKAFAAEVQIQNDDILSFDAPDAKITGAIDAKGSVWARVTSKDGLARAGGQFRGASATGAWSSNTAFCGGRWKARKIRGL